MINTMTSTQSVMVREHENVEFGKRVSFRNSDWQESADDRGSFRKVVLDAGDWRSLGSPEQITVTIEGGDRLNDEGS